MKLYLVHCGFYDRDVCEGIYESHTNIFVAAPSVVAAKSKAMRHPLFESKGMHVDGIQEVAAVGEYAIQLIPNGGAP